MPNRSKRRPRDPNQLAKLMVDLATGAVQEGDQRVSTKNPAAVTLGRLGGLKSAAVRARNSSPQQRKEIARRAAFARWKKSKE
jgi:hypothetical protein